MAHVTDLEQAVGRWLDEFPEDAVHERIEHLRAEVERLQAEIMRNRVEAERLTKLLHYRAQLDPIRPKEGDAPSDHGSLALLTEEETRGRPSSKREAVQRVLEAEPDRPWHVHEIRRAVIDRGWLTDDPRDMHSLDQTLSNMAKHGDLTRPNGKRGLYQLPTPVRSEEP